MAKKAPPLLAWDASVSRLPPERSLKEFDWFDLTNVGSWQSSEVAADPATGSDQPSLSAARALPRPASDQPDKCQ